MNHTFLYLKSTGNIILLLKFKTVPNKLLNSINKVQKSTKLSLKELFLKNCSIADQTVFKITSEFQIDTIYFKSVSINGEVCCLFNHSVNYKKKSMN